MPNPNYQRGRRREYQTIKALEEEGYGLVVRTAGSRSPVDVIAIKSPFVDPDRGICMEVKLVQVKSSKRIKKMKIKFGDSVETEDGSLPVERWIYPTRKNAQGNKRKKRKKK